MTKSKGVLLALAVASLGLWGCAQNKAGADAAAKLRDLESRHGKLEEDYQAVARANDTIRKRLANLEAELARQGEQFRLVAGERDELKQQVTLRTGERDGLRAQLVQFSRDLQNLVGRVEAAANGTSGPATVSTSDTKTN